MRIRSLRASFLVGSILWTLGLLGVSHLLFVYVSRYFEHIIRIQHWTVIATLAVVFMLGGLSQVRRGLSPLHHLRQRLLSVRQGRESRVGGDYPAEVQPLVDDLNTLIEDKERRVSRALARAGDLAHGLKTPLAVLTEEARRAGAAGQPDLAAAILQQVDHMRRQMDYHLAQARAAASGATLGARAHVSESVEGLARTLRRLHAERGLVIDVSVDPGLAVRVQREDLDEMLGNLLDNACKWARSTVSIGASASGASLRVLVDDDGPGLAPSMRALVLQRGVRADEASPGSGFGLAIVRDLADLYGGAIDITVSPAGGVRAELRLPTG